MNRDAVSDRELDLVAIQQIELRLVRLRVVVRHGLATADEDRRAIYGFNTELGLKQPRLVLVHLRRRLLVHEEQAHQPRAVAPCRSSSQPDARRLVLVQVLRIEQAVLKR